MKKTTLFLILLHVIITVIVIIYIDNGIRSFDISFYRSKDGGYINRFLSIIMLTTVFYAILSYTKSKSKIHLFKNSVLGFVIALLISIPFYVIFLGDNFGLTFHIITIAACYLSYFLIDFIRTIKNKIREMLIWVKI